MIEVEEFIAAYQKKDPNLAEEHLRRLFQEADTSEDGMLQFDEFVKGESCYTILLLNRLKCDTC